MSNLKLDLDLNLLIHGGKIHKQVQTYVKDELLLFNSSAPVIDTFSLAESIENKIKELTFYSKKQPLHAGIAFPTGLSINSCSAHFTPNPGDKEKYTFNPKTDIIKIDFGVHLQGHILDGAFSYTENPELQELIRCSEEATQKGIDCAGPDAILGEIGSEIQEIIESYEVEICNKMYPVKSTIDLCGHQIGLYHIHAGKAVPNIRIKYPMRMKTGEEYAIETFPTTGDGRTTQAAAFADCSHYMLSAGKVKVQKNLQKVYTDITSRFGTLAFCKRWLHHNTAQDKKDFRKLVNKGVITAYPPLYDLKGSYVAQTEKSIYITDTATEGVIVLN